MEILVVRCIKCQQDKPETEFHKGTGRYGNGKRSVCKSCCKERIRTYYIKNGDKIRKQAKDYYNTHREQSKAVGAEWRKKNGKRVAHNFLKWKYGISLEHYEQLLASQDGVCAICKQPPEDRRLAVDHDHVTGAIRGLLCSDCNTAIGLLDDNPATLEAAIEYLNQLTPQGD